MLKVYCNRNESVFSVNLNNLGGDKVAVFGFNGIDKINYKYELNGGENKLSNLAKLSKETGKVIISGTITDNYGILRRSAVIAERGKLLGITDMRLTINDSSFSGGGAQRVYQTQAGRIGVLVGDDILDFEGVRAMSLCDADFIVAIIHSEQKPEHNFLIRSYAYLFGLPILLINSTNVIASDYNGEICGGSLENFTHIPLPLKRSYRLVLTKQRGV